MQSTSTSGRTLTNRMSLSEYTDVHYADIAMFAHDNNSRSGGGTTTIMYCARAISDQNATSRRRCNNRYLDDVLRCLHTAQRHLVDDDVNNSLLRYVNVIFFAYVGAAGTDDVFRAAD